MVYSRKSAAVAPGILQDPAPQVMVFIPHTNVLTIPRQSVTERGGEDVPGGDWVCVQRVFNESHL